MSARLQRQIEQAVFTADFKTDPYWWDEVPRPELGQPDLPAKSDVVVIGSGYTGLNAALQTARAGRHTVVLDSKAAGWGCSTRNGGQISTSVKPDYEVLAKKHGAQHAFAILREGHDALAWIEEFVRSERIDCHIRVAGRFHGAHNPAQYARLAKQISNQIRGLEVEAHLVPRSEQHRELGSDAYSGGVIFPRHASIDPARYHQGLLDRVLREGARVIPHCAVTGIEKTGTGLRVTSSRGTLTTGDVIVATNGYTSTVTPWQRRRVIPVGSYVIATEPLAPGLVDRLMPSGRIVSDTRKVVYYYRLSPDRLRILFGGRVSGNETDPRLSAPKLRADLVSIFPDLAATRIRHSWLGFVAYTFDELAHVGQHEGIHYAMGYCGSGVSMASYLGMRTGQKVLGLEEGRTGFDGLSFQTRPLYTGRPWFLSASILYYRWRDRQNH